MPSATAPNTHYPRGCLRGLRKPKYAIGCPPGRVPTVPTVPLLRVMTLVGLFACSVTHRTQPRHPGDPGYDVLIGHAKMKYEPPNGPHTLSRSPFLLCRRAHCFQQTPTSVGSRSQSA